VQGVHPYTMNINGCTFRQLFSDASRITVMWMPSETEVDAHHNYTVLLAPRADIQSNGAVNSPEAAAPDIGCDLQSSSPTGNESSSPVNDAVTGNVDDTDVASTEPPSLVEEVCAVSDINENTSNTHVTCNEPQIITTQKGKPKLCYRGYMYHLGLHPTWKVDCLRWRCTDRTHFAHPREPGFK